MDFYALSDQAVIEYLGQQVRQQRVQQEQSQQELADRAGIDRATLSQFENGRAVNLLTFVQVLRGLSLLETLRFPETKEVQSPLERLREQKKAPQRIRKSKREDPEAPSEW